MARSYGQTIVRAGFIPLVDCAPLLVAATHGFAEAEGIELVLQRETSWANIRDKVAVGHLDVAHMLAPMPIAQNLGLGPLPARMITPMALGSGANTVTVSLELFADISRTSGETSNVVDRARAIASIAQRRAEQGDRRLTFAIVHPHSMHYYELAYWLASVGMAPNRDYHLTVLPPSLMADALASRQIDGFCVGEPWGSVAVAHGSGRIIARKHEVWAAGPEKVLGMRADWAEANPDALAALMRAIYRACEWCDAPANGAALVELLMLSSHLDQPASVIEPALGLGLIGGDEHADMPSPDTRALKFATQAATFPWVSHARWIYAQMLRFGQLQWSADHIDIVSASFRPDLYRAIIGPVGVPVPSSNSKLEGALDRPVAVASATGRLFLGPDLFFDGRLFDPDAIETYVAQVAV